MMRSYWWILIQALFCGSLAAFLWVGFRVWKHLDRALRLLVWVFFLEFITLPLTWLLLTPGGSNHFLHALRPLVWVPLILWILSRSAARGPSLHLLLAGIYLAVWFGLHLSGLESIKVIKGPSVGMMHGFLLGGAMLSLAQASTREDLLLAEQPVFWVASGVLLASAASMMMFLFLDRLMAASLDLARWANRMQAFAQISQTCCFIQALRCTART